MSKITNHEELTMALKFHARGTAAPKLFVHGMQAAVTIAIGEEDGRAHLTIDSTGPDSREDLADFLHMMSHAITDSIIVSDD